MDEQKGHFQARMALTLSEYDEHVLSVKWYDGRIAYARMLDYANREKKNYRR